MRILVGGDRALRSGCALLQLGTRPHKGLADGKGVLVGVSRGSKRWYWPPDKGAFRASHSRSGTASRFDHGSRQAERSHPLVFEAGPSVDVHPQVSTRTTRFTVIVEGQDELYPSQRRLCAGWIPGSKDVASIALSGHLSTMVQGRYGALLRI